VLLGADLTPAQLLEQPLSQIKAIDFALGVTRLIRLARTLRDGQPPDDLYRDRERRLYLDFEPENVRRHARNWHSVKELMQNMKARNDRAERLLRLWLLHPFGPPLRDYLELLFRTYVQGFVPETIVLCRSVLERGVKDALHEIDLLDGKQEMEDRIRLLKAKRRLTSHGARDARDVWLRGNKIIHDQPDLAIDPFETIEMVLRVLTELVTSKPDRPQVVHR
jgi:hypothetical protein